MKIKLSVIFPVLTALFVGLTLGLFLGRNPAGGTVTVSVPAPTAAPAVPIETRSGQDLPPVNINTADVTVLAALPGIGEVLAQRIIDYRQVHGDYTAPEQLTNVEGIGEGKMEAIMELITIGG